MAELLGFTHIGLRNWKNFKKIDVDLQKRVFIIGANASGKSNFLDAFRFLHDIVADDGGFRVAVNRRGGVSQIRSLSAERSEGTHLHVAVGTSSDPKRWQYELWFTEDIQGQPRIVTEWVETNGVPLLGRPDPDDEIDAERLTQTHLEQVNANRTFRELVSFFASIRFVHTIPQLIREPDRSLNHPHDPFGGDLLERMERVPSSRLRSRLERILQALQAAVPQLETLLLTKDRRGAPHLQARVAIASGRSEAISEVQLSDGTLRLISLLWELEEGTGPLLLEEPELSLHTEVIRAIPQMLAQLQLRNGRQVLISTHSTEMLQDSGIGLDEVLLLQPGPDGTEIQRASDFRQVVTLVESGLGVGDAVVPYTRPPYARRISDFGAKGG
ncbi:MAG: AAA family ATPase [Chloroflexi bacterium]|nr:AAA family ATPase [Chloroflexota bacterium]